MMNEIRFDRQKNRVAMIKLSAPGFVKDLILTLAAALWTGLAGSALFILLVFAMNSTV